MQAGTQLGKRNNAPSLAGKPSTRKKWSLSVCGSPVPTSASCMLRPLEVGASLHTK